jgi:hypothetical protein
MSVPEAIRFKPETEASPVEEAVSYVHNFWFQQLVPVRSRCYRCHKDSPVVHVPHGALAFGNPRMLRTGGSRRERDVIRDVTRETVFAFASIGWKFQLRRSYCPDCKGLGSVS